MNTHHFPIERIRNIGLIAHIDAGKTTVTERMLFYAGLTHNLGNVDQGNTVTDWMEQEKERGITIVSAAVSIEWNNHQLTIIDTPGHIDFTAEVQRALRVLDGAVVIIDAVKGVEPQSETVWRQANQYTIPRLCFINKLDRTGADFLYALADMQRKLQAQFVALQIPIGEENHFEGVIDLIAMEALHWSDKLGTEIVRSPIPTHALASATRARERLIEQLSEHSDELLEEYLNTGDVCVDRLHNTLHKAIIEAKIFPVLCGSALHNQGIQPVLDAVVSYFASPLEAKPITGTDPSTLEAISRPTEPSAPLSALIFKIVSDPYAGKMAYVRVYSGTLASGQTIFNPRTGQTQRIGRMVKVHSDRKENIDHAPAGEIDAILSLKNCRTGDTLCDPEQPILLEAIDFPEPVIKVAIEPIAIKDKDAISQALKSLAEEDPTFSVNTDPNSGQTILSGMGELHLEILIDRLQREHDVQVRIGKPRVNYKETITRPASNIEGRFVRQTGGHGQYGHVVITVKPGKPHSGITFINKIAGGIIPKIFIPAIEKGIRSAAKAGVMGGSEIVDFSVTLLDGSYHSVDSSELAFNTAAAMAFKQAITAAAPCLLEPIFKLEALLPQEYLGEVLAQLTTRRCQIEHTDLLPDGTEIISASAPIAEMFGYATEFRSATQGRGQFTLTYDHYSQAPISIAEQLSANIGGGDQRTRA